MVWCGDLALFCISIILNDAELSVLLLLVANDVEVELDTLVWLVWLGSQFATEVLMVDSGDTLLMVTISAVALVGSNNEAAENSSIDLLAGPKCLCFDTHFNHNKQQSI